MKAHKVLFLALTTSVVLAVSVQAGSHHGNSGARPASAPAFHSGPGYRSGGGHMIAPSQRFSSVRMRSASTGYRRYYAGSRASLSQRRITPGTFNRGNSRVRFQSNRGNRTGSLGRGNRGLSGVNNHVFARHSGDWHRGWDRHHDHWWHGHRCRWVNGYWFVFDLGFDPWFGYPYDYYYGYPYGYGYGYDAGAYEDAYPGYYDQNTNDGSDQNADSPVAAAQERLARQGYYRGEIDGIFGPETRRAITRYQSDHGLRVTGYLTADTLQALGLRRATGY